MVCIFVMFLSAVWTLILMALYHDISRIFAIMIFMMIYKKICNNVLLVIAAGRLQHLLVQTQ